MKKFLLSLILLTTTYLSFAQRRQKTTEDINPIEHFFETGTYTVSKGLFNAYEENNRWYFEIPDSLLNREIMAITRYIKTAAGSYTYGGEEVNSQVVKWVKYKDNTLFLKSITYVTTSSDSTKPIYKAVNNSNSDPIIGAFEIKFDNESTSYLIDVTDYFNSENLTFSLHPMSKEAFKLNSLQPDKSYINSIKSFPINTEVKTVKTYDATSYSSTDPGTPIPAGSYSGFVTLEFNTSFLLLPKEPMKVRYFDHRVGYYANELVAFENESHEASSKIFAVRWRLEPKDDADAKRQKAGELIEPLKPIVYYIDPATPEKWRPYLKAGIDDWNKAFEKAGWKNAIRGEYWPENDSTMSLEDARYSVVRYFASDIENAYGPNIHDPRSGEILESHIGWYHNVMRLLHDWYLIQASMSDPRARSREFDDELMGQLIRFVSSHEVGHTLGLRHNMGASFATPVEKLRDPAWCKQYGHTSSIMDYARFNYVAQPEDSVKDLFPRIGDYDEWAIYWGYRYFSDEDSAEEERDSLHLITSKKVLNPRLQFGTEISPYDPRYQTEDLGDNAMTASTYGIRNLQRILPNLISWSYKSGENYAELDQLYQEVINQFIRYTFHVMTNIGGVYDTPKTYDMAGKVFEPVSKQTQLEALNFIDKQVFNTPTWLLNKDITDRIKPETGVDLMLRIQQTTINNLLSPDKLYFIIENSTRSRDQLSLVNYFNTLKGSIFSELSGSQNIDIHRRSLQKVYLEKLGDLLYPKEDQYVITLPADAGSGYNMRYKKINLSLTDVPSSIRGQLEDIRVLAKKKLLTTVDQETKNHLIDLTIRINNLLDPKH
jgi:hypothetical protein